MSKIKLADKKYNEISFNVDCTYKYEFTLNSELENHQLTYGFTNDLILLLKEQFGEELEKHLNQNKDERRR